MTPLGKPSYKKIKVTRLPVYSKAPAQLFPNDVCELIAPLMFSDQGKIGHNLKFDLESLAKYVRR